MGGKLLKADAMSVLVVQVALRRTVCGGASSRSHFDAMRSQEESA
tara:strand:+ start:2861 stop:2995 length:135 start_codon:yes stop_codon:yes gene_type:complete